MSTIKSSTEHLTLNADGSGKDLKLQTNGTERVIVKSDGKVGIGTTSPDSELQIANNDGSSYRFGYSGTSDVYLDADNVYFRTDNGGANQMTLNTNGLGIGTSSPAKELDVSGEIRASSGILFGTDTAAANALDDYEEGTWTASFSGMSTTWTSASTTGYYVKIGRIVYVSAYLLGTTGTGTINNSTGSSLIVNGLPFTIMGSIAGRSAPVIGVSDNIQTNSGTLAGHGSNGSTVVSIYQNKDNGATRTSPTIGDNTAISMHFSFTYRT